MIYSNIGNLYKLKERLSFRSNDAPSYELGSPPYSVEGEKGELYIFLGITKNGNLSFFSKQGCVFLLESHFYRCFKDPKWFQLIS